MNELIGLGILGFIIVFLVVSKKAIESISKDHPQTHHP